MKILVLEALGLHLGYLGCYGNDWVATPNLDRLAVEGALFDWHYADQPELEAITPWERRSVGTGRYAGESSLPLRPRVVRSLALNDFADCVLAETAAQDSWLWIEGPSLLPPWTLENDLLDAYFDEDDTEEGLTPWRDPPREVVTLDDAQIVRLQNTYAAAVTFFDAQLGKIFDHLGDKDDRLICVTARSGLPLGEHGMIGTPRASLHDELVHVPLVMRLPRGECAGLRIGALTQPVDLAPTFLEALGHRVEGHGRSLWPLMRGKAAEVRPFAVSQSQDAWLMRTPDRALHLRYSPLLKGEGLGVRGDAVTPRMFVKPEDRWEVNDVYHHEIESADAMEKALRALILGWIS